MATLPIVYTENDKYKPIVARANEQIPDYNPVAQIFATEAAPGQTADLTVRLYHDQVIAQLDNYPGSGNFATRVVGAGPVRNITPEAKANAVVLQRGDVERDPGMLTRLLTQLGSSAQRALDDTVFSALTGAFSTTYNDGTGTPFLINANGGTLHSTKGATYTQQNNVNAALDPTSLSNALVILRRWRNWADGTPQDFGNSAKVLIVPPELERQALTITGSSQLPYTVASGLTGDVDNVIKGMGYLVIPTNQLTNTTRWFLISRDFTPVRWKLFIPPKITVRDGDNHTTIVEVSLEVGAGIVGPPDGLVGSSA